MPLLGDVTEGDDAADEIAVAVVQALAVDAEHGVGLFRAPVDRGLVRELLTAARAHQRQLVRVAVTVPVLVDATEGLLPARIGLCAWAQPQDRACGRVDIEHVARLVDDNDPVVDVAQYRQYRHVGVREPPQHLAAPDGMVKDGVLAFHRDVVDTDVALRACPYSRDAAVFMLLARQRDDRVGLERVNQFRQRVSRLRDQRPGLEQYEIGVGEVLGQLERVAPGKHRAAGQGFQFSKIVGGEFTATQIENGVPRHSYRLATFRGNSAVDSSIRSQDVRAVASAIFAVVIELGPPNHNRIFLPFGQRKFKPYGPQRHPKVKIKGERPFGSAFDRQWQRL